MFIGHYAVALAGKRAAPSLSLGTLFLAAQLVDLLWPVFLLAGIEHVEIDPGNTAFTPLEFVSYPYTHSLAAGVVWAVVLGGLIYWRTRNLRPSVVAGALVLSHWVLDFVTHRPDMPIVSDEGPKVGLGLWNSVPATLLIESALFIIGLLVYVRITHPRARTGAVAFWSLIVFIVLIYAANVFGPPPAEAEPIAWFALAAWLFPFWAWWADRGRSVREDSAS